MSTAVFFGAPSQPGRLRQLLLDAIRAVPAGGEILWATYYLANRSIIDALKAAAARGVKVGLAIEARPRIGAVNHHAIRALARVPGLKLVPVGSRFFAHLHEKLYFFSHPQPFFLAGSYNPSMDPGLESWLIDEIGDQDKGHNLLVKVEAAGVVAAVRRHISSLMEGKCRDAPVQQGDPSMHLFPNWGVAPHLKLLARDWKAITIAMSHIRDGEVVRLLCGQAKRGCAVRILSHESQRRFPVRHENRLTAANVQVWRFRHPDHLPMHSKYMLLEGAEQRLCLYGSLNLTRSSRWINREVLMVSGSKDLYAALLDNWNEIRHEIECGYKQ